MTWKPYALVALAGFALIGSYNTIACGYRDAKFLHDRRVENDEFLLAQKVIRQQQAAQSAVPPPVPKPSPVKPGG